MRHPVLYNEHDAVQIMNVAERIGSQHYEVRGSAFGENPGRILFANRLGTDYRGGPQGIGRAHSDVVYESLDLRHKRAVRIVPVCIIVSTRRDLYSAAVSLMRQLRPDRGRP
jgi:hypothetical protein